jgi:vibriolysin
MTRLATFVRTTAAGVLIAAGSTSLTGQRAPRPFVAGDPASLRQAEDLGLRSLRAVPALTAGVELGRARSVEVDTLGRAHVRVAQTVGGVPVFGAEAIVHLDGTGRFAGVTDGLARNIAADVRPTIDPATALSTAIATAAPSVRQPGSTVDLQILRQPGRDRLTYRVQLDYEEGGEPFRPVVFVDATDGAVVWSYDNLQAARNRVVYTANHGTTLPGALVRSEGNAAVLDDDVNAAYDHMGSTYDCYLALFGRDSYDNAGARLSSSVHYSTNYANGFWNGTQLVYGDGDNVTTRSYSQSMDLTAHELTHAVTERTSNLIYSGESGALNEAMSDIFGNVCEWYRDTGGDLNGPTSADNWTVYEDIFLTAPYRYMYDPALDGFSSDFWTPLVGNLDVHYSSGIANLAFYLAANGGTHPRGASVTVVGGIGIHDAARIFYLANTAYLTPTARFADARAATIAAAVDLFGPDSNQAEQIGHAWSAVGVLPPVPPATVLSRTDFEADLGGFSNGGADATRYQNPLVAGSGRYSVRLRDDSGVASSIFSTTGLGVEGYSMLRIEYSALAIGMEAGEDYFVEIQRDIGAWETVANFVHGTDFINNVRHAGDVRIALEGASTVKVRFRCDASDNSDSIFLDDVTLSAH